MRTDEAIRHFKTQKALAAALTAAGHPITQPSIAEWGEYPPDRRQLQIELIAPPLKAEPECRTRLLGVPDATPAPTPAPDNGMRRRSTDNRGGK